MTYTAGDHMDANAARLNPPISACPCEKGAVRKLRCTREMEDWVCTKCHRGVSGRDWNPDPNARRRSTPMPNYRTHKLIYHNDDGPLPLPLAA